MDSALELGECPRQDSHSGNKLRIAECKNKLAEVGTPLIRRLGMFGHVSPNKTHDSLVHIVGVVSWDIVDDVVYSNECEDKISCHDKAYENLQRSVNMIDPS